MTRRSSILRGSDGLPLSITGLAAVCAIPVSLGLCIWMAWPLKSIFRPENATAAAPAPSKDQTPSFAEAQAARLDQVRGRSLFFIPKPPQEEKADRGPKATTYAGPQLVAMINDTAWFNDGTTLQVGADPVKGLRVLRLNAPWSAHVEWQGGEFDVELFKRTDIESLKGTSLPPPPAPPATATASQPNHDKGPGPGAIIPPGSAPDQRRPPIEDPARNDPPPQDRPEPAPAPTQQSHPPAPVQPQPTPPASSPSSEPTNEPAPRVNIAGLSLKQGHA